MDFFLIERVAVARLQQRCIDRDAETILVRVARGEGVVVTRADWMAIGTDYRKRVRPSARALRWSIWLQIPFAIAVYLLTYRTPGLRDAADWLERVGLGWPAWLLLSVSLPLAGVIWHSCAVHRALRDIRAALGERPHIDISGMRPSAGLHVAEIVMLVLFGPGALIDLYGSINPHAFDHTPWMGRELGWSSLIGLGAFAFVVVRHTGRRVPQLARSAAMEPRRRRTIGPADPA